MNNDGKRRGFINNNNQLIAKTNFPLPAANTDPPVPPGSGIIPTSDVPRYNPQNINNNLAWLNTYDRPYPVRVDVYRRNITFREEYANKKNRLYVYTARLLATPSNVPIHHMPLDLDNDLPCFVIQIGNTNNDDNISFLDHVDTCFDTNTGNHLLHKYIMTIHPSLVAEFIKYKDADPFDTIILQCAVTDLVKAENDHGKLNPIFCYWTPYTLNDGNLVLI